MDIYDNKQREEMLREDKSPLLKALLWQEEN